jgi:cytochrome c oxidase cbb3-type subunit 3
MSDGASQQQPNDHHGAEPLHMFDGIAEMDNNPPKWLMVALILTVVWSIGYVMFYHLGTAKIGVDAWREDMEKMAELRAANDTELPDETTFRQLSTAPDRIARGKIIYDATECMNCHEADATGKEQGPNLRDRWWLHGSNMVDIANVIRDGANNNAMPANKNRLSNQDITNLTIYLIDLNRQGERPGRTPDPARSKEQPIAY